jgi:stage II sporulation protein D
MSRRLLAVLLLPLAIAGASWARAGEGEPATVTSFVISGHGWGHGVGMSQYGALGYVLHGVPYDRVLAHYYRGATLGPAPVAKVRVLLAENRAALTVASDAPFTVRDATGVSHPLRAGAYRFGPGLRVRAPAAAAEAVQPLPGPLTFRPGRAPLRLDRPYRGAIEVAVVANRLQAINVVGLDAYIRGVVSEEMPHDWPLEAVKTQAVAARSYALSQLKEGGSFDLYADTRDQVYGGIAAETPVGDAAVAATNGQVLLYGGKVIVAYFFSTSGGRTAGYRALYPDRPPLPYLVPVADPYDVLSPYHDWGPIVYRAAQVSKRLGLAGVADLRGVPSDGHAARVVVTDEDGETTLPATSVRRALELRSTWFRAGVLSLSRPAGAVGSGRPTTLSGVVKRLRNVVLEQRRVGATWEPGPELDLAPDGTFSVVVTPSAATDYRLAAGSVRAQPLRVRVAAP